MTEPAHPSWQDRGLLVLRGEPGRVASWAQRGLVPVHVLPLEGWTAVVPAGPSHAMSPYDDTVKAFAGRPVPSRLRGAIGCFSVAGNAVISAHLPGWRSTQRWWVWAPGEGVVQSGALEEGRPSDLVAAARTPGSGTSQRVRDILLDGSGDAAGFLRDLLAALALPGSDLLEGGQDPAAQRGSVRVEPGGQHVARFEKIIADEARLRADLEED